MTPACLILMSLSAAVQVTVAPDQPLSYVYIDDPLIIEFFADAEIEIEAQLLLQAAHTGRLQPIDLGRMHLHCGSGYWYAVHDAPRERGIYTAEFVMTADGETFTERTRFCRIDRPASLQRLPIYAYCSGSGDTCVLPAIRGVGIDTIRYDADNEQFEELAHEASIFGAYLIVAVSLEQARQFSEKEIDSIQAQCENILRFDVSCGADPPNHDIVDVLRQLKCPAGVSIIVQDAAAFEKTLQTIPSLSLRQATLMADDWPELSEIRAIKDAASRHGQEGWQTHVLCPFWQPRGAGQAARFIHKFLQYRAADVSYVGINAAVVADDMDVQEMMAYLNGLALRFRGYTYVGALPSDENAQALLFRSGAGWFVALWNAPGAGMISVPVDGAVNLELTDALGNTVALPEINGGALELRVSVEPLYLTGSGGVILGRAALNQLESIAQNIIQLSELSEQMPPDILELTRNIMAEPKGAGSRRRFLELLRALPRIEEQWHTRRLPRHIAVSIIVQLSQLARTLCLVEEDRGEHFLEPLSDTLSRAEELQSLYLTGSAGTARARERGDWILGEVRRLIDEAEALDKTDRKIEAAAVAALAEWRAHCLIHAAQADPAHDAIPETPPLILPEPPEEKPVLEEEELEATATDDAEREPAAGATATDDVEPEPAADEAAFEEIIHTVKSGDNPYNIAKQHNVSLDDLLKWNKLDRNSILRIGQKLIVRVTP